MKVSIKKSEKVFIAKKTATLKDCFYIELGSKTSPTEYENAVVDKKELKNIISVLKKLVKS